MRPFFADFGTHLGNHLGIAVILPSTFLDFGVVYLHLSAGGREETQLRCSLIEPCSERFATGPQGASVC